MTTETSAGLCARTPPPIRLWPVDDLPRLDFDPLLAQVLREEPVAPIQLPNGEGHAWLVTRYEDVKTVTNDERFGNPHLSLGHEPHYCVGPMPARLECTVTVSTLLERLPGLRPAVPVEEVRRRRGALIRGPETLPVTW
ncbi:hypothetical protein GCM10020367_68050 [Streptomyces sannanensis]|uniref:Cytochrome P450 n=1 Tax=Streptomyces sannanensis TaxID=285536 RepID=A0ABP6SN18_9ACTN